MSSSSGPVPDIVRSGLSIIFIGFNPGLRSGETGHHYAGYSNRFWKLLADSGLTPRRLRPEEDAGMLELGFGLTNIVPRMTRTAAEISSDEYEQGRRRLERLLRKHRPRIAAYNGIEVYRRFSGRKEVRPGLQAASVVPGIQDFVLFSPSGLVRTPYPEMAALYRELKALSEGNS